ncbi:histone deacetylase 14 [Quercus suber]|uniref:Histone deacetylase 14 n=1 Tax=Quercus suber TaxID=58331 RepID=A0AAW0JND0_QUESU
MDQASQQGIIFIDGSGVWTNIFYFNRRLESLAAAGAGITEVIFVLASRNRLDPPDIILFQRGLRGCVLGNVAIVARYAQRSHGLKGVFIIDFDAHHGNGTNDAYYDDPDIFIISTHQDGSYPGTGKVDEVGHGDGEGIEIKFAYTWRVR